MEEMSLSPRPQIQRDESYCLHALVAFLFVFFVTAVVSLVRSGLKML